MTFKRHRDKATKRGLERRGVGQGSNHGQKGPGKRRKAGFGPERGNWGRCLRVALGGLN